MHTDPQSGRGGKLKWYDPKWRREFIKMLNTLIKYFGTKPYGIEIHPGTSPNSIKSIAIAIGELAEEFPETKILLENRTRQIISNGININKLWDIIKQNYSDSKGIGIVLDIQQLFTQTGKNPALFQKHLRILKPEAILGVHIHSGPRGHHVPSLKDPIPWMEVSKFLKSSMEVNNEFLINPEVHTKREIQVTKAFIERNLLL